jgi:hypothetical protein
LNGKGPVASGARQRRQQPQTKPRPALPSTQPGPAYVARDGGLFWNKPVQGGAQLVRLTNFLARVVCEVERDDGAERSRSLEIEASYRDRVLRFEVPAMSFTGMSWVLPAIGAGAIIEPGFSIKEHARAAIQHLSGDPPLRTLYTHLGWRERAGEWFYLHAGGALGASGSVAGVTVDAAQLGSYVLPDPKTGEPLQDAVRASLKLLDVAPADAMVPILAAIYRAPLGQADFSLHLWGATGTGKTELAALAQQHFGAAMDARHLPGSWSSTGNALEILAFLAKDAVLVVDDFAPSGPAQERQRLDREASRFLRAQGNLAARQRLRADASLRPPKPPRCLTLSTGEEIPAQHSVRARTLVIELAPGAVRWDRLTEAQELAATGVYAVAMAGYIQWLAGARAATMADFWKQARELRSSAFGGDVHMRTPHAVAELGAALKTYFGFCAAVGALSEVEAQHQWEQSWHSLRRLARAQAEMHRESDPVLRFAELLSASLAGGSAHVAALDGGAPGDDGVGWGWRRREGYGAQPLGLRIGWIDDTAAELFLVPDTAFRAAELTAGSQPLGVGSKTLWKRLAERGLLLSADPGKNTTRVTAEGQRPRVLHVGASLIVRGMGPTGPAGPTEGGPPEHGPHGPIQHDYSEPAPLAASGEPLPREPLTQRVLDALAGGRQASRAGLVDATGLTPEELHPVLDAMFENGEIKVGADGTFRLS